MGNLKPDAVYTYTQRNGITYAQEHGSDENIAVGWKWDDRTDDGRPLRDHIEDSKLWGEIRREAKTNPALHKALERAKIIYYLSKDKENIEHHRV
jgi:hypothetical protein